MIRRAQFLRPAIFGVLVFVCGHAMGQATAAEEDDSCRFAIGPAAERDLRAHKASSGAALSVEKTLVEDWLELEVGASRLNAAGRRESGIEVVLKKPFRLSQTAELMVGLGPQVVRKLDGAERGTALGIVGVLDFMFWPAAWQDVGWYVEPDFARGLGSARAERSFGASAGLLLRWR